MRENRYTQAVSEIKAPKRAVDKALETAREFDKKENVIDMKNRIKGAVAASLAAAICAGAVAGINIFSGGEQSFVMTVNAAEIDRGEKISVGIGDGGMSVAPRDDGMEYCVDLPLAVSGDGIESVTYSVEKDAIAVTCRKDNNPVIDGELICNRLDTIFDVDYIEADQKALDDAMEIEYRDTLENPEAEEIMSRYEGKKYSSVTLAYENQKPDGCVIGIVGKSSSEIASRKNELLNTSDNDESLSAQRDLIEELIGNTVHCTVRFEDGSEEKLDIEIGAEISTFGEAYSESFSELTDAEKEMKDYKGVFVTYTAA